MQAWIKRNQNNNAEAAHNVASLNAAHMVLCLNK